MTSSTRTPAAKPAPNALKDIKAKYAHVTKVAMLGVRGQAIRVVVKCTERGCSATREIATQDAFQVTRCLKHQKAYAASKRRKQPVKA